MTLNTHIIGSDNLNMAVIKFLNAQSRLMGVTAEREIRLAKLEKRTEKVNDALLELATSAIPILKVAGEICEEAAPLYAALAKEGIKQMVKQVDALQNPVEKDSVKTPVDDYVNDAAYEQQDEGMGPGRDHFDEVEEFRKHREQFPMDMDEGNRG